jgi:hypothetical protein
MLQSLGPVATLDDPKTVVVRGALVDTPGHAAPERVAAPAAAGTADVSPASAAPVAEIAEMPARGPRSHKRSTKSSGGRIRIAAGAALAIALLGVGGFVAFNMACGEDSGATAAASAPRSKAEDEQAIREFIPHYVDLVNSKDEQALTKLRCSTYTRSEDADEVPADQVLALKNIVSVSVSGDTASSRIVVTTSSGGKTSSPTEAVFNTAYEDGEWKFCSVE